MENIRMFERLKALMCGEEQPQESYDPVPHRRSPILGHASTVQEVREIAAQHRGKMGRVIFNGKPVYLGVPWTRLGDCELFLDENGQVEPSYTY
jgi:hypothetical protein